MATPIPNTETCVNRYDETEIIYVIYDQIITIFNMPPYITITGNSIPAEKILDALNLKLKMQTKSQKQKNIL